MSDNNVIVRLKPIFEKIEDLVRNGLTTDVPYVSQVSEHILLAGGKRLRPALFVLTARMCGYQEDKLFEYSTAFEYVHAATLLHDDVVDESDMRRGKKAAHIVYGNKGTILVGDFLLAKALAIAAESGRQEFTDVMSETVARMAEGEILQLLNSKNTDITEEEYENVIYRKTGILIESACRLGGVYAEGRPEQIEALRSYGRKIGKAFQIIDDALDFTTTAEEFGKPVGHDLDEGKITLPVIKTLASANEADRNELLGLIHRDVRSDEEKLRVKALIDKYEGLERSLARASEETGQAQKALDIFPESEERQALADLADFIVSRRK